VRYLLGILLSIVLLGARFVTSGLEEGVLVSFHTNAKLVEFLPEFESRGNSSRGCLGAVRCPELTELVGELGEHFEDLSNGSNELFVGFEGVLQHKSVKDAKLD
jgi:hypothetical protein